MRMSHNSYSVSGISPYNHHSKVVCSPSDILRVVGLAICGKREAVGSTAARRNRACDVQRSPVTSGFRRSSRTWTMITASGSTR